MSFTIYDTGTVTLTNGSAAIVGTGTAWSIALITGGILAPEAAGNMLPIESVEDDTHATAAVNWVGATGTYAYAIARETSEAMSIVRTNDRLAQLLTRLADSGALGGDPGILLVFDTATADADQGPGLIWANNANLALATQLFISKTSRGGSDISAYLLALDDSSSTVKGSAVLTDPLTEEQAAFKLGAVTDATGYVKVAVSAPAGETSFVAGTPISFQSSPTGDAGSTTPSDGSVTTAKLATNSVTTVKITDANVTNAKLANMANATLKGRNTAGTGVPEDVTMAQLDALLIAAGVKRERLTANRTYYVRVDGSNSNTGLVNSAGGAFLTLQKAWDVILTLDLNGYDVTISVGNGTYTAGIITTKPPVGGNVILVGNVTTPANVIISTTSADALSFDGPMLVTIGGFELRTTTGGFGINAKGGARVVLNDLMRYGATAWSQLNAINNGTITINANYTISGAAQSHWRAEDGGLIDCKGRTVTISGTPAFSVGFCVLYSQGRCTPQSNTYSGSATGLRYNINQMSLLHTNGAGATALPGGTSGTTGTGATYV